MKGPIPILTPVLVALFIGAALGLLAFFAGRTRPSDSLELRRTVFRYRLLLRSVAAFASVFFPAVVTFLLLLLFPRARPELLYVAGAYLLVGIICLPMWLESVWYFIAIDDDEITQRSAWRGIRSFPWHDVSELRYSTLNMWFIIRFESDAIVRVPIFVGNLKEFLIRIEQHLPVEALRRARKGYEKVGRPFPALINDPVLEARPPR